MENRRPGDREKQEREDERVTYILQLSLTRLVIGPDTPAPFPVTAAVEATSTRALVTVEVSGEAKMEFY